MSIEPRIAAEDVGNFTLQELLPSIETIASNPTEREDIETYIE
jgi:hypothetical protein